MGLDFTGYPKLTAWFEKMHAIPGFEENLEGAKEHIKMVLGKIGKNIF